MIDQANPHVQQLFSQRAGRRPSAGRVRPGRWSRAERVAQDGVVAGYLHDISQRHRQPAGLTPVSRRR